MPVRLKHCNRSLTQQQQLDVLGRLDAVLLEVLLDLLRPGPGGPLLRGHGTPHLAAKTQHRRRGGGGTQTKGAGPPQRGTTKRGEMCALGTHGRRRVD